MKNPFLRIIGLSFFAGLCLYAPHAAAQTDTTKRPAAVQELYEVPDEPPILRDGNYIGFINANLRYPEEALKAGIQGTVILRITVSAQGTLTQVEVMQGIGGGCTEEAIRVAKLMRNWIPAKMNGQPVVSKNTMRIKFSLPADSKPQGK